MTIQLPGVSREMLKWAREKAGLSLSEVASAFDKDIAFVESWERGVAAPSYAQLEVLAYKLYNRPLAAFFLPKSPEETPLKKEFRTLPRSELKKLAPDTLMAIRELQARQTSLHDLTDGKNPSDRPIFQNLAITPDIALRQFADDVRRHLEIPLSQQLEWRSSEQALENWRTAIDRAGVISFKRSFKQKDISGFCLLDNVFPLICLNNGSSTNRQIFTLLHELCHVLLHTSGICKVDDTFIKRLEGSHRKIEVLCNQFAAAFLVPEEDFLARVHNKPINDSLLSKLASAYRVSRSVVVRRMYDLKVISRKFLEEKESEYAAEYMRRSSKSSGGNYYLTQIAYLGKTYLGMALRAYHQERLTRTQLAEYLGVRARSLAGLEQAFLNRPGFA